MTKFEKEIKFPYWKRIGTLIVMRTFIIPTIAFVFCSMAYGIISGFFAAMLAFIVILPWALFMTFQQCEILIAEIGIENGKVKLTYFKRNKCMSTEIEISSFRLVCGHDRRYGRCFLLKDKGKYIIYQYIGRYWNISDLKRLQDFFKMNLDQFVSPENINFKLAEAEWFPNE